MQVSGSLGSSSSSSSSIQPSMHVDIPSDNTRVSDINAIRSVNGGSLFPPTSFDAQQQTPDSAASTGMCVCVCVRESMKCIFVSTEHSPHTHAHLHTHTHTHTYTGLFSDSLFPSEQKIPSPSARDDDILSHSMQSPADVSTQV
jgi:hypothetical protein